MKIADVEHQVATWREEFDASFRQPVTAGADAGEAVLAIGLADTSWALPLTSLGGILRCPRLTPMPSTNPSFMGLAGVRGGLVAVYSLRTLLGVPGVAAPAWLALGAEDRSIGLAFDVLVGHATLLESDLAPVEVGRHTRGVTSLHGREHRVLDADSLLAAVHDRHVNRNGDPT